MVLLTIYYFPIYFIFNFNTYQMILKGIGSMYFKGNIKLN